MKKQRYGSIANLDCEANTFERSLHGRFMSEQEMYIAGEWTSSENGDYSEVINPAIGATIARVPKASINDVNRCVSASRDALVSSEWKNMDPAQRGRILNKMAAATYGAAKELSLIHI